jgi:hypothetical protein
MNKIFNYSIYTDKFNQFHKTIIVENQITIGIFFNIEINYNDTYKSLRNYLQSYEIDKFCV